MVGATNVNFKIIFYSKYDNAKNSSEFQGIQRKKELIK